MRLESGSIVHDVTDLILETPDGLVIIDHKAYPGTPADARDLALSVTAQIQVYADATSHAIQKTILENYIHLPLIGIALKFREILLETTHGNLINHL